MRFPILVGCGVVYVCGDVGGGGGGGGVISYIWHSMDVRSE